MDDIKNKTAKKKRSSKYKLGVFAGAVLITVCTNIGALHAAGVKPTEMLYTIIVQVGITVGSLLIDPKKKAPTDVP